MLCSYDWYHLMFIFQVPYKKFDKNNTSNIYHIYTCYDIFIAGGEHKCFYICYNPFSVGGEHITYFLQGKHLCTQSVIIKKGENVGTCFWWDICEAISFGALSQAIQEFYMIKTSQRELIMMCIVIVDSMLKALTHTHTHIIAY